MDRDTDNVVVTTVTRITELLDESHDLREELSSRGAHVQTVNALIEMGFHGQGDQRESMIGIVLSTSQAQYGAGGLERETLEDTLKRLGEIEEDIAHTRRMGRQQGLDLQAVNFLTQMIRKHPGDGGERVVNTLFGYALACGLELHDIAQTAQRFGERQGSVLPDIPRRSEKGRELEWRTFLRDAAIGLGLSALLIAFTV